MPTQARERLIAAAKQLFYAEGIRAVGIDKLLTASGVGRASFYRHFASKDDLVVTVLRGYDERYRTWLREAVEAAAGDPLSVFDALATRFGAHSFRGCSSINAMIEIFDANAPAHRVAAEHKRAVIKYLDGVLAAAGYADHAELAERFMLLMDGATVTALRERTPAAAHQARSIASHLLLNSDRSASSRSSLPK